MQYGYEILDHLTWADVAFKATGKHLNEMFENAALATTDVMIDLKTVSPTLTQHIELEEEDLEHLLFLFLSEIVYLKDAEQLFFSKANISVTQQDGVYKLTGSLQGERLDPVKHTFGTDVKAITLHHFKVEQNPDGWECQVVVDV
jgi:SHS2 domain-containing protein